MSERWELASQELIPGHHLISATRGLAPLSLILGEAGFLEALPHPQLQGVRASSSTSPAGGWSLPSLPPTPMFSYNYPRVSISDFRVTRQQALGFQPTSQEHCSPQPPSTLSLCGHSTRKTDTLQVARRKPGQHRCPDLWRVGWMDGQIDRWVDE